MGHYLQVERISKTFPGGLVANDGVSLAVEQGTVHALLGENGAGKSTLMKILYGVYKADSGTIAIDGKPVVIHGPHDARAHGIGMVFQSFMLIPSFRVIENVALSLQELGVIVDAKEIERRIRSISERYGFDVDPQAPVWQLSIGAQQKVEIIKLLVSGARLLIFDEPTSVLAPHEAEGLFKVFDTLRADGYTIIFISHKLKEVLHCADRVTVLRQGRVVGGLERADMTEQRLVSLIVGENRPGTASAARRTLAADAPVAVELRGVSVRDDRGREALHDVSLRIRAGEIIGVAGVSGNGQPELGDVILGVRRPHAGTVLLGGEETSGRSVEQIRRAGVACIPEEPLRTAGVGAMTVEENLALALPRPGSAGGWRRVNWAAAREKGAWITERFQLRMPRLEAPLQALSGGNIQRVIFARELATRPKVLIAYYPTRGLDIHAAAIIRSALLSCRDEGAAILLISEDLDELLMLSDRVMVLYHGQNVGECLPEEADIHEIGFLMTDGKRAAAA